MEQADWSIDNNERKKNKIENGWEMDEAGWGKMEGQVIFLQSAGTPACSLFDEPLRFILEKQQVLGSQL